MIELSSDERSDSSGDDDDDRSVVVLKTLAARPSPAESKGGVGGDAKGAASGHQPLSATTPTINEAVDYDVGAQTRGRYFAGEDLSTKCFNCGEIGHMAAFCRNERVPFA